MVHSHVGEPAVASTSKRGSEGDRDDDDRKRRPPPRKSPPEEASVRPRRCRKCKSEGKKGRKYRSAKGLREHCVCHHSCTYRAVTDRYITLSTEDCRRQVASIQASRRHRPASDSYFVSPPSRVRGRGVHRVEATPTTTATTARSTATTSVSSAKLQGAGDSRHIVLHPNRLPSIYSSSSSGTSDDENPSGGPDSPLREEFAECCAPAVPPSPVRSALSALAAAIIPPLVEPVVSTNPVVTLPGEDASKLVEPSAVTLRGVPACGHR